MHKYMEVPMSIDLFHFMVLFDSAHFVGVDKDNYLINKPTYDDSCCFQAIAVDHFSKVAVRTFQNKYIGIHEDINNDIIGDYNNIEDSCKFDYVFVEAGFPYAVYAFRAKNGLYLSRISDTYDKKSIIRATKKEIDEYCKFYAAMTPSPNK